MVLRGMFCCLQQCFISPDVKPHEKKDNFIHVRPLRRAVVLTARSPDQQHQGHPAIIRNTHSPAHPGLWNQNEAGRRWGGGGPEIYVLTSPPGDSDARQGLHSSAFKMFHFTELLQFLLTNCLRIVLYFDALKTSQMKKEGCGGSRTRMPWSLQHKEAQHHRPAPPAVPARQEHSKSLCSERVWRSAEGLLCASGLVSAGLSYL